MRRITALLMLFFCMALSILAQSPASSATPTRLRVSTKGAEVIINWEASADAPGGWALYKSIMAPTSANFPEATQVAVLGPQERSYSYSPPDRAAYYYFVQPLDSVKKPQTVFLPGKNVTAVAIANDQAPVRVVAPAAKLETPAFNGPAIGDLVIAIATDSIKLSFSIVKGTGNVLVYRGTTAFVNATNLLDAILISTIPDSIKDFVDYPVPGLEYFYALIPESSLKAGRIEFKPGANTSRVPAMIAASGLYGPLPEIGDLARITPLPSYLFGSQASREGKTRAANLLPDTEKAISLILQPYPVQRLQPPQLTILNEDRGQAKGGEDYALSLIIQGPIKRGDYADAAEQLQRYLSLNRSKAVASRAHFYLGQALARNGSYRDAFFEFLQARDLHAMESRPWIIYVVSILRG